MKIAYLATCLPRECGIATFNHNLYQAIALDSSQEMAESYLVAINDHDSKAIYDYPPEVKYVIRQNQRQDYKDAAAYINQSGAAVCVLQHEYGIYGGEAGYYLLNLIHGLEIPLVSILHTILKEPTYMQLNVVREIARKSAKVIVMSHRAVGFLKSIYKIKSEKIQLIEHGVPDLGQEILKEPIPDQLFHRKRSLLTFGLISRNKGLETVITALPAIIAQHPDITYYIIGKTHPGVMRKSGEEYRIYLEDLAGQLGVSDHVKFINAFLSESELFQYLSTCTLYVTPYLDEAQITSGTLSYAIGAGAAVLSTPYWHAQELLAQGRGELFGFKDSKELASKVNRLLTHEDQRSKLKEKAFQYGITLRWPSIGRKYLEVLHEAIEQQSLKYCDLLLEPFEIPRFNLAHVQRLTDDTGIVQHARFGIPNLKEGYCLDDNARALLMATMAYHQQKNMAALDLIPTYLSYIQYLQRADGNFRNFLSFSRQYLDEQGSEDSFGRTIWALGYLIHFAPNNSYREFAQEILFHTIPHFASLTHLRGVANTLIGVCHYLKIHHQDEPMLAQGHALAHVLCKAYEQHRTTDWHWFEDKLTYDNALLPMALLCHYDITGDMLSHNVAMESMAFLESKTMDKGYLHPIGNSKWLEKDKEMGLYDQQAIETMAMVLLYDEAFDVSNDSTYLEQMDICYQWFLGHNTLRIPLYDEEMGGCCDGLHEYGVNRNQGAESTLAYLISHLTIEKQAVKPLPIQRFTHTIEAKLGGKG
ncbi:glycosyltransferase [Olivibacter sitiensis]|uniref:glycosyltransferase n=1 Tax=Olivibacter sitiensis TaxID=376470 RepID=UPI00040D4364|nr:glycosyltransferase [Olivibacter sitiensis]